MMSPQCPHVPTPPLSPTVPCPHIPMSPQCPHDVPTSPHPPCPPLPPTVPPLSPCLEVVALLDDDLQAAVLPQDGFPHLGDAPRLLLLRRQRAVPLGCGTRGGDVGGMGGWHWGVALGHGDTAEAWGRANTQQVAQRHRGTGGTGHGGDIGRGGDDIGHAGDAAHSARHPMGLSQLRRRRRREEGSYLGSAEGLQRGQEVVRGCVSPPRPPRPPAPYPRCRVSASAAAPAR